MAVLLSGARQDKKSRDLLDKILAEKKELEKSLNKLTSETSLKQQMFEGLKAQYDELEREFDKIAQAEQNNPKISLPKSRTA